MASAILNKKIKNSAITANLTQQNHGKGFFATDLSLQRFPELRRSYRAYHKNMSLQFLKFWSCNNLILFLCPSLKVCISNIS